MRSPCAPPRARDDERAARAVTDAVHAVATRAALIPCEGKVRARARHPLALARQRRRATPRTQSIPIRARTPPQRAPRPRLLHQ